jgi:tetratricopeptide (TPR) repeat protein
MISSKPIKNPFPGLRPFETDEYRLFFGREGQSDELLARLQRSRFLAVVGTSGSGKSSLIRAGLMPALRGGMMRGAGSGWRIAVMRPGGDPAGNLAVELAKKDVLSEAGAGLPDHEAEAVIEATLRSGSLGIVNLARQARLGEHEKLLIVVDQFEEIFRFRAAHEGSSVDEASAFVKLLLEAAQQRELSIYIVLTMRSDYLGDCAQFQGLPEAINDGQYLIPRMTRDERRFAVTGPVGVTRGKITEPLINRLLNDVGDNPDQLPILQHALMRTWEHWQAHRRNGEPIGIEHYEAIGTMFDALSLHADEAFNELPNERSRQIAESLFKALSERGADNREIRRPTRLDTLCKITEASLPEVIAVIEVFRGGGRSFLMPPAGTRLGADSVIDISHESLIRNWQRLRDWVNEEAQSVRIYRRVAETAMLHREGSEGLMQDPALSFALDWREKSVPNAAWGGRYHPEFETAMVYLDQSRLAREERLAAEEKRRNEEIERDRRELEQTKLFVAQQARAARRMRWLIVLLCVILLLALATAAYALNLRSTAISERENAIKLAKIAESANERVVLEAAAARQSEQAARDAQLATDIEKRKVEETAALLDKQRLAALDNLHAAQIATEQAKQAKAVAEENERQVAGALERGELMRLGLESSRREDYDKARDALEKLEEELKPLQPNGTNAKKFTPEQSKQFTRDYGWTLSRLGDTHHKLHEYEKAIEHYENGRVILEDLLKNEPAPILFETYHGLANAYHENGKFRAVAVYASPSTIKLTPEQQLSKAEEFYRKAASYQETHLKSDNPLGSVTSLKNLAQLYIDIGRYDDAEQRLKSVVDAYRKNDSSRDEGTRSALKELAEFYRSRNKYQEAVRTYNELINLQEALVFDQFQSDEARDLADNYVELGQVYNALNDNIQGDATFQLAELIQHIVLKIKHRGDLLEDLKKSNTAITLDDDLDAMGDNYIKLARFEEAKRSYETALFIREQLNSEIDARAISYLKLAKLYREHLKDYAKAESYYKKLIDYRRNSKGQLFGENDPLSQYIVGLRQLAGLYTNELNKPADAEALLNTALTALEPIADRQAWDEEEAVYTDLLLVFQKQAKAPPDMQALLLRKWEAMTKRRKGLAPAYRTEDYPRFMFSFVSAAGEVADLYLARNDKASAAAAFAQVFDGLPTPRFGTVREIDTYASKLEKYQSLLRELKKPDIAASYDAAVKEARTQQKYLEAQQPEPAPRPKP